MRVYLAAGFSRMLELREYAKELRASGHDVTSSWLRERANPQANLEDFSERFLRSKAEIDLDDIDRADTFIVFTLSDTALIKRAGSMVETGYAMGKGKKIICIGPYQNIFMYLKEVEHYEDWNDFRTRSLREVSEGTREQVRRG